MGNDSKYLAILEKIATDLNPKTINRARLASCLVIKNEIVAFGVNQLKSHPFQAKFSRNEDSIYLHAETDCIKNSLKHVNVEMLHKATMYICRVKRRDNVKHKYVWGLSKPCEGCARAIATFGIKKVVYSCDDGNYKYL